MPQFGHFSAPSGSSCSQNLHFMLVHPFFCGVILRLCRFPDAPISLLSENKKPSFHPHGSSVGEKDSVCVKQNRHTGSIITKNPVNCQCRFAGWLKNFQKSYCSRLGERVLQSQQCRIQYIPVPIIAINIAETVFGFFSVFAGNRTGVIYSVSLVDFFFQ